MSWMLSIHRISNEVAVRKVFEELSAMLLGNIFMLICGIDIGKNNHEASVIDQDGRLFAKSLRFSNTTSGAEGLLPYIARNNTEKQVVIIGMEATGHDWLSLYCFLFDAGFQVNFQVNMINPIQSDAIRNLFLRKTKNDAKDSFLIAETIRIGRFSKTKLADEDILSMRRLCRDYIADQKRKIIGVMDRVFPEYQSFFSDMFGKTSTELLSKAATPEELLAIPTDE